MKEKNIIKEFCAENFTDIPRAICAGADRIELCDNLHRGGTTPSYGVIKQTLEYAGVHGVPVMTMIRPRGGNFVYAEDECAIMLQDIAVCKALQSDGVVFGCLKDSWIDEAKTETLIRKAEGMNITFHMAFDELTVEGQYRAIDWLSERKVERILTHGGLLQSPIEDNLEHLSALIAYAKGRIIMLPGGGIRHDNLHTVLGALHVQEVHGTKIVDMANPKGLSCS